MIAWFATKGSGTNEAARMDRLLSGFPDRKECHFDKQAKKKSFLRLLRFLRQERPALCVMEGTGLAGGLACLAARFLWKVPYVFSSGDAVGPFVAAHAPLAGPLFHLYERLLCRYAAGFIGWTPYLCGRAMTLGCTSAVTAPGWSLGAEKALPDDGCRARLRQTWGVPEGALVVGLVGALEWNAHRGYCYGLELVRAVARLEREDIVAVIIGGGSGLERLRQEAGALLGSRIIIPGAVPLHEVPQCLAAFDIASLPQSTDAVGAFRYTTKLSEYAEAHLPVISSRISAAYDLGSGWMWRLPGAGPWEQTYIEALANLLESMQPSDIQAKKAAIPENMEAFDRDRQVQRVTEFLGDLLPG